MTNNDIGRQLLEARRVIGNKAVLPLNLRRRVLDTMETAAKALGVTDGPPPRCDRLPDGWQCLRATGHEDMCSAWQVA